MNNLPLVLLMLLAGCTEQTPAPLTEIEDVVSEADPVEVVETEDDQALFKVIKIVDGDTIDVLTNDKETIRLRFNGIDAPERGQPFGNNATKFVSDTVGGKMVRLVTHGEDRYGRAIADIYLPVSDPLVNLPDKFLNRELVSKGLAWHYKEYSDDERLAQDEQKARADKLILRSRFGAGKPRHSAALRHLLAVYKGVWSLLALARTSCHFFKRALTQKPLLSPA